MRAEATVRNSMWGLFQEFIICILSLFSRRVMIDTIGVEGVGLNGLLTNVVAVLSLAEMGIGSVIVFHMYKPIADDDKEQVLRLLNFYKIIYRIIAATVLVIGLCLMPFLKYIVHDVSYSNAYVRWIYFLFIMQTVTSYLFAYKRSMLTVNQKQYIAIIYSLVCRVVTIIGGIAILIFTKDFAIYLIFLIVSVLITNIALAHRVNKMYPYVKNGKLALQKEERRSIFSDIKNMFVVKIAGTITQSTDNILISALVGTIVTGLYTNYTIILNALSSVMKQFSFAMSGSIGNLVATETADSIESVFKKLVFGMFFMAAFCCACLVCLIDPFITLAFGNNLLLDRYVVYICIGVFYFMTTEIPVWNMVSAAGLFKPDKYISIAGTIINLIVSFVLGKMIGIGGILLGTICTYVIQYYCRTVIFFKKALHRSYYKIVATTCFYIIFTVAECFLVNFAASKITIANPYIDFILTGFITAVGILGLNTLLFRKTEEYKYFKAKITTILLNKIKKRADLYGS